MIQRTSIMAMLLFCLCMVTGCRTSKPNEIDFFDAYHRPDVPREEWPTVPEIVRNTHSWDKIPRYLAISKNLVKFGKWTEEELSALAEHDIIQLSSPTEFADRRDLAAELKRRNPNIIIIGNALRSVYPDCLQSYVDAYLHGSYLEAVEQKDPERYHVHLAHLIDTCIRMQHEGGQKLMCITMTHLDPPTPLRGSSDEGVHVYDEVRSKVGLSHTEMLKLMRKNFEFKLAVALTMASNYFYFGYASGHIADGRPLESLAPDYPEFKRPLGPPLGPAVKTAPYRYQRKFKHASVELDVATRTGRIDWHTKE